MEEQPQEEQQELQQEATPPGNEPTPFIDTLKDPLSQIKGMPDIFGTAYNVAGTYQTGPERMKNQGGGTADMVDQASSYINQAASFAQNPNDYGRTYTYGAGAYGANFERYYGHNQYKNLGFNPVANNDINYNQHSSWWDDFSRMASSFVPLFGAGFKSMYSSGDSTGKAFEKAMLTGGSTRGGAGEFIINLGLNSAFTLGIAGEMVAENYALLGLAAATGGAGVPEAASIAAARNAMGLKKIFQAFESLKTMKDLIKELANINKSRQVYDGVKAATLAEKTWNFVNPLSRSQEYLTNLYKGTQGFDTMSDFVKTRKAFGAFYRDIRELNATFAESMMEGSMNESEHNRDLVDKFYEKNGRMPNNKEAQEIYERSKSVGGATAMANMPVIYFTNKLVFDNLFSGFKPPKTLGKEVIEGSVRDLQKAKTWKLGDDVYSFLERTGKTKAFRTLTQSPYLPWSRKYLLANLGEGIQEFAQDATAKGARDYYEKIYSDPAAAGFYSFMDAVGSGVSGSFNKQGLETFLSGLWMGTIAHSVGKIYESPYWAPPLYKKYKNSDEYKQLQTWRQDRENKIANSANTILKNPLGYFNENVEHAVRIKQLSQERDNAEAEGHQRGFQDAKDEISLEHLYNLSVVGKTDLITDHLDAFSQLSDKELAEAFNEAPSEAPRIRQKLGDAKQQALEFQNAYNFYKEKIVNPFNPKDNLTGYIGVEKARKNIVMSSQLFGRTLERRESIYNDLASNPVVKNILSSDITSLLDGRGLGVEIALLRNEVNVLTGATGDAAKDFDKKSKKLSHLERFRDLILNHENLLKNKAEEGEIEENTSNMFKEYKSYIKELAKQNDDRYLTDQKIHDSFIKVRDYFSLSQDASDLNDAINLLTDPIGFIQNAKRETAYVEDADFIEHIKKGTKVLDDQFTGNSFLQAISAKKATIDPTHAKKILIEKNFEGIKFYDSESGREITPTDPRYKALLEEVDNYKNIVTPTPAPAMAPPPEEEKKPKPVPPPGTPKELFPLWEKQLEVTPDESHYFDVEVPTDLWGRVSSLKGGEPPPKGDIDLARYQKRGVIIDAALRIFLQKPFQNVTELQVFIEDYKAQETAKGKIGYDIYFTDTAYKQLLDAFNIIADDIKTHGFEIYSTIPTLWGSIGGRNIAGTIDLLAKKGDKYYIIDLKTSIHNRREDKMKEARFGDRIQLNAYRELIKQRTGINIAGIVTYPMQVESPASNQINSVKVNVDKETRTIDGKTQEIDVKTITVPMDLDIYQLLGINKVEVPPSGAPKGGQPPKAKVQIDEADLKAQREAAMKRLVKNRAGFLTIPGMEKEIEFEDMDMAYQGIVVDGFYDKELGIVAKPLATQEVDLTAQKEMQDKIASVTDWQSYEALADWFTGILESADGAAKYGITGTMVDQILAEKAAGLVNDLDNAQVGQIMKLKNDSLYVIKSITADKIVGNPVSVKDGVVTVDKNKQITFDKVKDKNNIVMVYSEALKQTATPEVPIDPDTKAKSDESIKQDSEAEKTAKLNDLNAKADNADQGNVDDDLTDKIC